MSDTSTDKNRLSLLFLPLVLQESVIPLRSGPSLAVRQYGNTYMTLSGGVLKGKRLILPSGVMARRLLHYFVTQARITGDPRIQLPGAPTLLRRIGLGENARQKRRLKSELLRLVKMTVDIDEFPDGDDVLKSEGSISLFSDIELLGLNNDNQLSLFGSYIEFSPKFFQTVLQRQHQPIDCAALHNLDGALATDIYLWIHRRCQTIRGSKTFTWRMMEEQFGREGWQPSKFRKAFAKAFDLASAQMKTFGGGAGYVSEKGVTLKVCPQQVEPVEQPTMGW